MDTSPFEPEVVKEGTLSKLGGGAGGTKNWKDRYFVLTDHLYYYNSKSDYSKDPKSPLGRINLLSYYVSRSEPGSFEFYVHAYPKVRLSQSLRHFLGSSLLRANFVLRCNNVAYPFHATPLRYRSH